MALALSILPAATGIGVGASGNESDEDSVAARGTGVSAAGWLGAAAAGTAAAGAGEALAPRELTFALTGALIRAPATGADTPATAGLEMASGASSCEISIENCG